MNFARRQVGEAFARTMIEQSLNVVETGLREISKGRALRQVVAHQPIEVLDRAALRRAIGMGEEDAHSRLLGELAVGVELLAVVDGQRVCPAELPQCDLELAAYRMH